MLFFCPGCQRTFDETGVCPFDRSQLVSMSDARTIVTGPMQAVPGPSTELDRHGTLPLTPTPVTARGGADTALDPAPAAELTVPAAPPAPAEARDVRGAAAAAEAPRRPRPAGDTVPDTEPERAPESDYDRLVGQTLDGRYHIEQKIGEGGMGVVFAARHAVIERPLAIKVLKREIMRDGATAQRFVQEAKAASRIGHPNIVDVTDFGTTPDGMTYSVMEYVSGQTLGAALRAGGPFEPARAVRIAAQIARALGAAHGKGIVHRDLKPENVFLLDRDGRPDFVKIVDFGIAKVTPPAGQDQDVTVPRLTRVGTVFGTPEYMAPEQAAGRDTDARVDVYALGVILYEMVTGRVPHKGETMVRTLAAQMIDPAVPPSQARPDLGISPELEALIMKTLAKPREERFQTMGELLAALDELAAPAGARVSKSRVFGLVPLPPGADPGLAASAPAPPLMSPAPDTSGPIHVVQPITDVIGRAAAAPAGPAPRTPEDAAAPTAAPTARDEPRAPARPLAAEHADRARRTWPVLLLAVLVFSSAAAIAHFVASRDRRAPDPAPPAGSQALGPALAADAATADAAAVAATEPPADAAAVAADEPSDAGPRPPARPRDPDLGAVTAPRRDPVEIQILTKPEGGTLYLGTSYLGVSGARVSEAFGTRLEVTCKHPGYRDGVVKLVFDGKRQAELCVLQRIVICIPGVKNPFDKCPE